MYEKQNFDLDFLDPNWAKTDFAFIWHALWHALFDMLCVLLFDMLYVHALYYYTLSFGTSLIQNGMTNWEPSL